MALTVVVTNFQRPNFLIRCLQSLQRAGVDNVVLTSAAPTPQIHHIAEAAKSWFPEFRYTFTEEDEGVNRNWLNGLALVKTSHVLILHDDDYLDDLFMRRYRNLIEPQLGSSGGASWRWDVTFNEELRFPNRYFFGATRVANPAPLKEMLLRPGTPSLSPTIAVFPTKVAMQALEEAERNFQGEQFHSRPGMMIGNDLLLWLRGLEKAKSWLLVDEVLTHFGGHPGSETIHHLATRSFDKLLRCYDRARTYFLNSGLAASASRNPWAPFTVGNLPGVQVIMSVHNDAKWLPRALESLERSMKGFRWILVVGDDGSTDDTWHVLSELYKNTSAQEWLLRPFQKAPNVSIAKNRALEIGEKRRADYPAIVFMDADDEAGEEKISWLLPRAVAGGHLVVRGDFQAIYQSGQRVTFQAKETDFHFGAPMLLMHHSVIPENGQLFLGVLPANEDFVCWNELDHRGYKIACFPGPVVHRYYLRGNSVSNRHDRDLQKQNFQAAKDLVAKIRKKKKVALVGWNTPSGLGSLNRALVQNLQIDRWFVPKHPVFQEFEDFGKTRTRITTGIREEKIETMREWLRGSDSLLFCELPTVSILPSVARELGVRNICIPMAEYLYEGLPWIPLVDLFLCPTEHCFQLLTGWKEKHGWKCEVVYQPWPIAIEKFPFVSRKICNRLVFFNGTGGCRARMAGGRRCGPRKGADLIAKLADLVPDVPFLVRTQKAFDGSLPEFPKNCEVRYEVDDFSELYREGDVAIQPSRYEGIGLQLLECQAAGIPLVTTDAAPMNEYRPIIRVPAEPVNVKVFGPRWMKAWETPPECLAAAVATVFGQDIEIASFMARLFAEERSWERLRPSFEKHLGLE